MEVLKPPAASPQTEEAFMNWSDFYLVCFLVGFGLSALALLAGSVHLHIAAPARSSRHSHFDARRFGCGGRADLSWFNFGTIAAFLAWFGGTGYLLEHYYRVWFRGRSGDRHVQRPGRRGRGLLVSGQGADGRRERRSIPPITTWSACSARLSIPIRAGGTGELVYSQEGTRRVAGARSEDGAAITQGRRSDGHALRKRIAYVRPLGRSGRANWSRKSRVRTPTLWIKPTAL